MVTPNHRDAVVSRGVFLKSRPRPQRFLASAGRGAARACGTPFQVWRPPNCPSSYAPSQQVAAVDHVLSEQHAVEIGLADLVMCRGGRLIALEARQNGVGPGPYIGRVREVLGRSRPRALGRQFEPGARSASSMLVIAGRGPAGPHPSNKGFSPLVAIAPPAIARV